MSVNVTVHGGRAHTKRGKVLWTDVEELKKNEILRRRALRLLQVRQQCKDIASQIRARCREEKTKQNHLYELEYKEELREREVLRQAILRQQYQHCLSSIGQGHRDAAAQPDPEAVMLEERKRRNNVAAKRGEAALELSKLHAAEATKKQQDAEKQRDFVRTVENIRSSAIASLPQKVSRSPERSKSKEIRTKRNPLRDVNKIPVTLRPSANTLVHTPAHPVKTSLQGISSQSSSSISLSSASQRPPFIDKFVTKLSSRLATRGSSVGSVSSDISQSKGNSKSGPYSSKSQFPEFNSTDQRTALNQRMSVKAAKQETLPTKKQVSNEGAAGDSLREETPPNEGSLYEQKKLSFENQGGSSMQNGISGDERLAGGDSVEQHPMERKLEQSISERVEFEKSSVNKISKDASEVKARDSENVCKESDTTSVEERPRKTITQTFAHLPAVWNDNILNRSRNVRSHTSLDVIEEEGIIGESMFDREKSNDTEKRMQAEKEGSTDPRRTHKEQGIMTEDFISRDSQSCTSLTSSNRVQLYDHTHRFKHEYDASTSVSVTRLMRSGETNARMEAVAVESAAAAAATTDAPVEPSSLQTSVMQGEERGHVTVHHKSTMHPGARGRKALHRLRLEQEYKKLLSTLGSLSKEERICRTVAGFGAPVEAHISDFRLKEHQAERQRTITAAFQHVAGGNVETLTSFVSPELTSVNLKVIPPVHVSEHVSVLGQGNGAQLTAKQVEVDSPVAALNVGTWKPLPLTPTRMTPVVSLSSSPKRLSSSSNENSIILVPAPPPPPHSPPTLLSPTQEAEQLDEPEKTAWKSMSTGTHTAKKHHPKEARRCTELAEKSSEPTVGDLEELGGLLEKVRLQRQRLLAGATSELAHLPPLPPSPPPASPLPPAGATDSAAADVSGSSAEISTPPASSLAAAPPPQSARPRSHHSHPRHAEHARHRPSSRKREEGRGQRREERQERAPHRQHPPSRSPPRHPAQSPSPSPPPHSQGGRKEKRREQRRGGGERRRGNSSASAPPGAPPRARELNVDVSVQSESAACSCCPADADNMRLHVSVSEDSGGGPADEGGGGHGRCGCHHVSPRRPHNATRRRSPSPSRSRPKPHSQSKSRSPSKTRSRRKFRSLSRSRSGSDVRSRTVPKRNPHSPRRYSASSPTCAPRPVSSKPPDKISKKLSPSPARTSHKRMPAHKKARSPPITTKPADMHHPSTSQPGDPRSEVPQCLCWSERLSRSLPRGPDDSASTMYLSPPDQLTAQASAELEALMGLLRSRTVPVVASSTQDELRDSAPPRLDPLLEQYVLRLLTMSRNSIECLNVSSSNVSISSDVVQCRDNMCPAQTQTSGLPRTEDTWDCPGQRSVGVSVSPEQLLRRSYACNTPCDKAVQPCLAPPPVSSSAPTSTIDHSPVPTPTSAPASKPSTCQTQRSCPATCRRPKPVLATKQPPQKFHSLASSDAPMDTTEYLQHQLFTSGSFRRVPASAPPANPALLHYSPDYRPLAMPAASRPLRVDGGVQVDDLTERNDCPSLCCPCDTVPDPQAVQTAWRSVASDVVNMSERCAQRIESLARLIEYVRLEKEKLAHLDATTDSQQTPLAPESTGTASPAAVASASASGGRSPSPMCATAMPPCSAYASSYVSSHTPPRTPSFTPPCTPTRSSPAASPRGQGFRIPPGQTTPEPVEDTSELWFQRLQRQQSARPVSRQHPVAPKAPRSPQSSPVRLASSPSSSPQRPALSSPRRSPTLGPCTVSTSRSPAASPCGTAVVEQRIESSPPQRVREVPTCGTDDGDTLWVFAPNLWPPVDTVPAPVPKPCNAPSSQERDRSWLRSKPPPAFWGPRVPYVEQHELSVIPEVDSTLTADASFRRSPSPINPPRASPTSQLVDIVTGDGTKFYTGPRENLHGLLIATHMAAQECQPWVLPGDTLPPDPSISACPPFPLPQSSCPRTHSPRGQSSFARSPPSQSPCQTPRVRSPCHDNPSPPFTCTHSPQSYPPCVRCARKSPPLQQQREEDDDPDIVAELIRRGVLRSPFSWMKSAESVPYADVDMNVSGASSDFISDLLNSGSSSTPRRGRPSRSTSSPEHQRQRGGADVPPPVLEVLSPSALPVDDTNPKGDALPEDLEGMFERLGLGWAASMLRKTQEAMAISSSSSDTSRGAMRPSCGGGGDTSGPLAEDGVNRSNVTDTSFGPRRRHSTPVEVAAISDGSGNVSWQRGRVFSGNSDISSVPCASSQELSTPNVSLVVKSKNKSDSRT